jgi:ATP-dependent protease ClpP protease subunit
MSKQHELNLAIRAMDDGSAELDIFDAIGRYFWGIAASDVAGLLRRFKGKAVKVRINSPGGVASEGAAIYNLLAMHDGPVAVDVVGMAASAASVIAMAGKPLRVAENSLLMVHDAWNEVAGNAAELRKMADALDKDSDALSKTYARRTGKTAEEMRDLMKAETWMTADEAIEAGFADETIEASPAASVALRSDHMSIFKRGIPAAARALVAITDGSKAVVDAAGNVTALKHPARDMRALASDVSFEEVRNALQAALRARFEDRDANLWVWVCDVYDDNVVYEFEGASYRLEYSYDESSGKATLVGDPKRVRRHWEDLEASASAKSLGRGAIAIAMVAADHQANGKKPPDGSGAAPAAAPAPTSSPHQPASGGNTAETEMPLSKIIKALNLSDDASEDQVLKAITKLTGDAKMATELEAITGRKGSEALGAARSWKTTAESHAQLADQVAELRANTQRRDFDAAIAEATKDKKITPAQAKHWGERFGSAVAKGDGEDLVNELRGYVAVSPRLLSPSFTQPGGGGGDVSALTHAGKQYHELAPVERHALKRDNPELFAAMQQSATEQGLV